MNVLTAVFSGCPVVSPSLGLSLDGIFNQAVSWKLKSLRLSGVGWRDNWHSVSEGEDEESLASY